MIKQIASQELHNLWVAPHQREKKVDGTEINTSLTDVSRSGKEFGEMCKLIRKGLTKEQAFKEMDLFSKWASAHQSYKDLTYKKAIFAIQKSQELNNALTGKVSYNNKPLVTWTLSDFDKLKKDRSYVVEQFIYPKTVTMLYSPPGEFKSLLALDMGMKISTGKPWFKIKTKKQPVLYCDKENNDQILKDRLAALYKGERHTRKKTPFYVLRRQGDLLNDGFIQQLNTLIDEKKIKVIFFDTLHRFADYNENQSDDLNRLYTKVFQPLTEKGCSVIFLHHTKKDGGYRGSGDFLGMVDTAYQISRTKTGDSKSNKFKIFNEKSRAGEIEQVMGEIDFGVNSDNELEYIKMIRLNEAQEKEKEIDKLKATTKKIIEFMPMDKPLKRKDLEDAFTMANVDYTVSTLKRSLKWLVDNDYCDYDSKKFTYWRLK